MLFDEENYFKIATCPTRDGQKQLTSGAPPFSNEFKISHPLIWDNGSKFGLQSDLRMLKAAAVPRFSGAFGLNCESFVKMPGRQEQTWNGPVFERVPSLSGGNGTSAKKSF